MIFGYARCSTNETKQDISRQVRELKALGAVEIYTEYESGTKISRPELQKLLGHVQAGDTIVCTEISRITRSTKQLCSILELAISKKLRLIFGDLTLDCSTELNAIAEAMVKIMGVFSELERNMTVDRIRSGLRHAKAKGVRLGRPPKTVEDIPPMVIKHFDLFRYGQLSKTEYARLCEVSRTSIYKYIALMTDNM